MKLLLFTLALVASTVVRAAGTDAVEIKFMSFNVCHCEGMDKKIDLGRVAARIREANPDFVGLQEIDRKAARVNGADQPEELARATGLVATFAKAIPLQGGEYGVLLLSRQKPLSVIKKKLPGREPRVLLLCEFPDCWVGTTHLSVSKEIERIESVKIIRSVVENLSKTKPVFLSGDWNAKPDSSVLKSIGEFMTVVSDVNGQTFHGGRSRYCIDYIAVDSAHAAAYPAVSASVIDDRVTSDHAPIVATVSTAVPRLARQAIIPAPAELRAAEGVRFERVGEVADGIFRYEEADDVPVEGYELSIRPDGIAVRASSAAGRFYAHQTLRQLAVPFAGKLAFPCLTIRDAPRFRWRGVHLDEARHFFGKAAVKRLLDLMAEYKLNVFHWHLTDNTGWRLPVKGHPELTTRAAQRPYSKEQRHLADLFEDGVYGPFAYTEDEIREVVAYALARQIHVVPEVDLPGHSRLTLDAHPDLRCFAAQTATSPEATSGAVDNVFCLGNDDSLKLFDEVFEAVCALFPGKLVHIGGDEVCKDGWKACPKCQARMVSLGLKDVKELQAWQMNRTAEFLASRGKRVIGWDEMILDGEPPKGSIVMSWRGTEGGLAAAKAGLKAVMTPHLFCYFDYDQCIREDPATYPYFTAKLSLRKVYSYDPLAGIPAGQESTVIGGQCCNWTEYTCNETELQWKMWPRACATAEVFWTPAARKDFADFRRRMETHRSRLVKRHVNCAPLD